MGKMVQIVDQPGQMQALPTPRLEIEQGNWTFTNLFQCIHSNDKMCYKMKISRKSCNKEPYGCLGECVRLRVSSAKREVGPGQGMWRFGEEDEHDTVQDLKAGHCDCKMVEGKVVREQNEGGWFVWGFVAHVQRQLSKMPFLAITIGPRKSVL